jgi:hypothetical protein
MMRLAFKLNGSSKVGWGGLDFVASNDVLAQKWSGVLCLDDGPCASQVPFTITQFLVFEFVASSLYRYAPDKEWRAGGGRGAMVVSK